MKNRNDLQKVELNILNFYLKIKCSMSLETYVAT